MNNKISGQRQNSVKIGLNEKASPFKEISAALESDKSVRRKDIADHFPFISSKQLERWASKGKGPQYWKIGRDAVYWVRDVAAYVASITQHVQPKLRPKSRPFGQFRRPTAK